MKEIGYSQVDDCLIPVLKEMRYYHSKIDLEECC